MRQRLLILCPGQGSQDKGMFDLVRSDARAAAMLASFRLPEDPALLFANRYAQPAIVGCALATWEALRETLPAPALVAGYSIGELAAYGVAGALSPTDTVQLAGTRARLMSGCLQAHPGQALAAVSGLLLAQTAQLVAGDLFYIAIETGEDACIVGGPAAALTSIEEKVLAAGGRCAALNVEVASHTPYMQAAVAPFAAALRDSDFHPQIAPVLSGIAAEKIESKAMAIEHLSRQLAEKILWRDCMDACAEAAVTVALELGPGASLSRMLQLRHPHIACRSVADFRSLDGVRKWLDRQFN
jgi:[acyl-carrier-protein] S-malonyltransferase